MSILKTNTENMKDWSYASLIKGHTGQKRSEPSGFTTLPVLSEKLENSWQNEICKGAANDESKLCLRPTSSGFDDFMHFIQNRTDLEVSP